MATITYVPSRLGEGFFIDVPAPGSGDDDKALTYDHGTGNFVYEAFDAAGTAAAAVAAHVAASDPHSQYELESNNTASAILTKVLTVDGAGSGLDADLLDGNSSAAFLRASGADTGATASRQVFTNGITAPNWQPASDSTTALQMRDASGTAVVTVDTTSGTITIQNASGALTFADYGIAAYFRIGGNANLVFSNDGLGSRSYFFQGSAVDMSSTTFQYMSTQVWNGAATLSKSGNYIQLQLAAATIALSVKGAAAQSANLQEWQDSSASVMLALGPTGQIKTNQAASNTNTPSGATAKQLPIYDTNGTLLGYIPIYGSAW